jgi:hypothetical protein
MLAANGESGGQERPRIRMTAMVNQKVQSNGQRPINEPESQLTAPELSCGGL